MRSDKVFESLASANISLGEILQACPFDSNKNLGGRLKEEDFFRHLFIKGDYSSSLAERLTEALSSELENNRLLIIDGFSGTGKTTFLKSYIRENRQYDHVYIDFYKHMRALEAAQDPNIISKDLNRVIRDLQSSLEKPALETDEEEKIRSEVAIAASLQRRIKREAVSNSPIAGIVKGFLGKLPDDALDELLFFVDANRRYFARYLSQAFIKYFEKIGTRNIPEKAHGILSACDLSDVFILFFVHCFRTSRRSKATIVYFDNLDAVSLDYLSDCFCNNFATILTTATEMAQDTDIFPGANLDFSRNYKFVFCLRDANGAAINAHIADSLGHTLKTLSCQLRFEASLYREVMRRRLSFFEEITRSKRRRSRVKRESASARAVCRALAEIADDSFFKSAVVPLFNCDYRKMTLALFEIAKDRKESLWKTPDALKTIANLREDLVRFCLRGDMAFSLITLLMERNFLGDYPFFGRDIRPGDAYCLHSRMILNFILNNSNIERVSDVSDPDTIIRAVSLSDILESFVGIYPPGEVVGTLFDAFLLHSSNWVHLVTWRLKPLDFLVHREAGMSTRLVPLRPIDESDDNDGFAGLHPIAISLTPAAFVYLKYILPHFEFYSKLAGNKASLFSMALEKSAETDVPFLFQEVIQRTQSLVKRHLDSMNRFFREVFADAIGFDEAGYLQSPYAFYYAGSGRAAPVGCLHSDRIVLTHLEYLDHYREFLLRYASSKGGLPLKKVVNRLILELMRRYVEIGQVSGSACATALKEAFTLRLKYLLQAAEQDDFPEHVFFSSWYSRMKRQDLSPLNATGGGEVSSS